MPQVVIKRKFGYCFVNLLLCILVFLLLLMKGKPKDMQPLYQLQQMFYTNSFVENDFHYPLCQHVI